MILSEILNENAENPETMDMPIGSGAVDGEELRPLTRAEFNRLSLDDEAAYIMALRERFFAGNNEIAELFGCSTKVACDINRALHLPPLSGAQHSLVRRAEWEDWMAAHGRAVEHKPKLTGRHHETPPTSPRPSEAPQGRPQRHTEAPCAQIAPATQTITYRGALADVATMLAALGAIDAGVRTITVSWT